MWKSYGIHSPESSTGGRGVNSLIYEAQWNVSHNGIRNNDKSIRNALVISFCVLGHCRRTCEECSRHLLSFIPSLGFEPCPMKMSQPPLQHPGTLSYLLDSKSIFTSAINLLQSLLIQTL